MIRENGEGIEQGPLAVRKRGGLQKIPKKTEEKTDAAYWGRVCHYRHL